MSSLNQRLLQFAGCALSQKFNSTKESLVRLIVVKHMRSIFGEQVQLLQQLMSDSAELPTVPNDASQESFYIANVGHCGKNKVHDNNDIACFSTVRDKITSTERHRDKEKSNPSDDQSPCKFAFVISAPVSSTPGKKRKNTLPAAHCHGDNTKAMRMDDESPIK